MSSKQVPSLWATTGVLVYLSIVFLNAFVDLGHKILIQNTLFKVYDNETQIIWIAIVNALMLLPVLFLFSPSGFLSDRYPKHQVMRVSALVAFVLVSLITVAYHQGWFWVAYWGTLAMAAQTAIYGPAKYGYIKALVRKEHLTPGNGMVQALTIIAILVGTIVFSFAFELFYQQASKTTPDEIIQGIAPLGYLLIMGALLEVFLSYRLPAKEASEPRLRFEMRQYINLQYLRENLKELHRHKFLWFSTLGLAAFWAVSQFMLAVFPAFAKSELAVSNTFHIQLSMLGAGVGIFGGSIVTGWLSKRGPSIGGAMLGAIGVAVGLFLMPLLPRLWMQGLNFLLIGFSASALIIPLNTLIQLHSPPDKLGRMLASYRWIEHFSMVSVLILTTMLAIGGATAKPLIWLVAILWGLGVIFLLRSLGESFMQVILHFLFRLRYRCETFCRSNLPGEGGLLLLANHISSIDVFAISVGLDRKATFVIPKSSDGLLLRVFAYVYPVVWLDESNYAQVHEQVREGLLAGQIVVMFPEGDMSRTGHFIEIDRGFEIAAGGSKATVLPVNIDGLWGSRTSHAPNWLKFNNGIRRRVVVRFDEPQPTSLTAPQLKKRWHRLSMLTWQNNKKEFNNIPSDWISRAKSKLFSKQLIDQTRGVEVSNLQLIVAVFWLRGEILKRINGQNVGVLLPTSAGGIMMNLAGLSSGKTVVNLNFTASESSLLSAIAQTKLTHIFTSKTFLNRLEEKGVDLTNVLAQVEIVDLESIRANLKGALKIRLVLQALLLPAWGFKKLYFNQIDAESRAAILFSSGSEGAPKGVCLTHQNLMANVFQASTLFAPTKDEVLLSNLPIFHAFGLMAGVLKPLLQGYRLVTHADPTDVIAIAKSIHQYKATLMFSTSTFLRMFVRNKQVTKEQLSSLRTVVAGAEKLSPKVREAFYERFEKHLYEGYGVTECSPALSCNLPDKQGATGNLHKLNEFGTVGQALPGVSIKIIDPETNQELNYEDAGEIVASGPQVMEGYLDLPEKTTQTIIEMEGQRWYRTGDKGYLNKDGYVRIVDRYSRFAKLGGEMVSLSAVEEQVREALGSPEEELVAVNVPCDKKGEKVVLLVGQERNEKEVMKILRASSIQALMMPSMVRVVETIPKLGSGKTDFSTAKTLATS